MIAKRATAVGALAILVLAISLATTTVRPGRASAESGAVLVAIGPAASNVRVNEAFGVDIQVRAGSQPVAGVAAYLSFDRNYLRVVDASGNETGSIAPGAALPRMLVNSVDNGLGRIHFEAGLDLAGSPASGDFVLATIRFKAIATTPSGGTAIAFLSGSDAFDGDGNSVLGSTATGVVVVSGSAAERWIYLPAILKSRSSTQAAIILNGDFEGPFYAYGTGEVGEHWVPYDNDSPGGAPQYRRMTLHVRDGNFSQMFWKNYGQFNSGIYQVIGGTALSSVVRVQAGRIFTARVWTYSTYGSPTGTVQDNKIYKRVGIDPYGGTNPRSGNIQWTPPTMCGQDKLWIQIACGAEAMANQITLFIEAYNVSAGGQDQVFIDDVSLDEEGVPPATPTPQWTATPTPTPTPMIDVVRTVSVGRQPKGIAVIPELNCFLVANSGDNSVSRLEGFLDWHQSRFSSNGERPSGVATDPDRCLLYAANTGSNSVSVFNVCGSVSQPAGTVVLGEGKRPDGIAVLTTTNTIYVANAGSNSVSVINGATLAISKEIQVGPLPGQIAVNPKTNKVYVTSRGYPADNDGSVTVIDGNTQNVLKTIGLSYSDPVPAPEAYGVAVNPATNRVYVATASGKLVIIDGASDNVLRAITPPTAVGLSSVAVNPRSNNVYVASAAGNLVFVYDAEADRWLRTLTIGGGQIGGIAINPLTYHVLVSNTGQDNVSVVRDFGAYQPLRSLPRPVSAIRASTPGTSRW